MILIRNSDYIDFNGKIHYLFRLGFSFTHIPNYIVKNKMLIPLHILFDFNKEHLDILNKMAGYGFSYDVNRGFGIENSWFEVDKFLTGGDEIFSEFLNMHKGVTSTKNILN